MDMIKQSISAGIAPFELHYEEIHPFEEYALPAYRSVLQINHLKLGSLLPAQYQTVANRDLRCVKLAKKAIHLACDDIARFPAEDKPQYISVSIPGRMLQKNELVSFCKTIPNFELLYAPYLCFSFSYEILLEDSDEIAIALRAVKQMGVQIELFEYGCTYCPTLRIQGLPLNRVVLDATIGKEFETKNSAIPSCVISFAHQLGMKVVVSGLSDEEGLKNAERLGANAYLTGRLTDFLPKPTGTEVMA